MSQKNRVVLENIKANIFSTVFLIVLGTLLLLAYYLLKDYVTSMCFAFISAIAIKPLKNKMVKELMNARREKKQTNIILESKLVQIFKLVYFTFVNRKEAAIQSWEWIKSFLNTISKFRQDILSLIRITILYVIYAKVGILQTSIGLIILLLLDFIIRAIIFSYRTLIKKIKGTSITQNQEQVETDQEAEERYNSIVTTLCVFGFISAFILILVSLSGLCLWDIIDIRNKASVELNQLLIILNQYLESAGIKSYLDEKFIKEQVLTQVDKLDTYISGSNLLPAIQVFQGVVNTYLNATNAKINEEEATLEFRKQIDLCQIEYSQYSNLSYVPDFISNSAKELTAIVCYVRILIVSFEINLQEVYSQVLNNLKNFGGNLQNSLMWLLQFIFRFFISLIDYLLQLIIYLTSLYYLIVSPKFNIRTILLLLPFDHEIKNHLEKSLEENIIGVFAATIKVSFYHIILTWLMLDFLDLPFTFLTSVLAGIIAVLPIVPVYCITIPYCLYLYFINGKVIQAFVLLFGYLHVSVFSINAIYSKNIPILSYITGICVAMGMSVFDLKGIIIGPLIVCSVSILIDVLSKMQNSESHSSKSQNDIQKQKLNVENSNNLNIQKEKPSIEEQSDDFEKKVESAKKTERVVVRSLKSDDNLSSSKLKSEKKQANNKKK